MPTRAGPVVAARSVPAGRGWQWIVDAWTLTAGYRPVFLGLTAAVVALAGVADMVPLIGPFAAALMTPILIAGLVIGSDALRRGEPLTVEHLFAGFKQQTPKLLSLGVGFAVASVLFAAIGDWIVGPEDIGTLIESLPNILLGGPAPALLHIPAVLVRSLLATLVVLTLSLPLFMALWFAIPLVTLRGLDALPAIKLGFMASADNTLPFLVWSVPPLVLTIVILAPFIVGIAARSLLLGLLAVPLLLLDFLLLAALTFVSIYTSYRDVFPLGE